MIFIKIKIIKLLNSVKFNNLTEICWSLKMLKFKSSLKVMSIIWKWNVYCCHIISTWTDFVLKSKIAAFWFNSGVIFIHKGEKLAVIYSCIPEKQFFFYFLLPVYDKERTVLS